MEALAVEQFHRHIGSARTATIDRGLTYLINDRDMIMLD